ncbi:hypothetical protein TraAM80_00094 [Trypanosoma rangeli]|uniref:Uncharacterized protein n=1 Tax=Trypanosoma rangeli TaxID=5698 RepID=A0A3S5ISQ5_TRYRA|nr:uncharacterized protein TraAM80_00094 [Trypanosoma rangeli]RNF12742.1 hypothetical protein TraAM80_00094 [Trypanosoma rangeli]|eukprot:RNF12742.1 hypothetical protein TraAM80_00094 [Trypanosoma rangeli]
MVEGLPLVPHASTGTLLQDAVDNILSSSHDIIKSTLRLSDSGVDDVSSLEELVATQLPRKTSRMLMHGRFDTTTDIFQTYLEDCRDVLRMVDNERCFFREKALKMQNALEEESNEAKHLRLQLIESQRELRKAQRSAIAAKKREHEMAESLAAATEEQMRLRRLVRAMPRLKEELLLLVPDRRFEEAFRDKMCSIKYKRCYHRARELYEQRSERVERNQMAMEDSFVEGLTLGDLATSLGSTQFGGSFTLTSISSFPRASNSLSSQPLLDSGVKDLVQLPFQLPFSHVTEKDGYIKKQVQRSVYKVPLQKFREGIVRLSLLIKRTQDVGLRNLYGVMLESFRAGASASPSFLADPRKPFEAAITKLQASHLQLLYKLLELADSSVLMLLKNEAENNKRPPVSTRDVGCCVYLTAPMDLQIASLEPKFDMRSRRSASDMAEFVLTNSHVNANYKEMRKKAETTLQQLLALHGALQRTLQTVQSHCHLDEEKSNDLFEELFLTETDAALEDPRYETKIAGAVEADLKQSAQLADSLLRATKHVSAPQKEENKSPETTGATLRKRQLEHKEISRSLSLPQGGSVVSRKSIGLLTAKRSASSKKGPSSPQSVGGTEDSGILVVTRSTVVEAMKEIPKAQPNAIMGGSGNPNSDGRPKRTSTLSFSKAKFSTAPGQLSGSQKLVPHALSQVHLPPLEPSRVSSSDTVRRPETTR